MMRPSRLLLGVSGGIAAYKTPHLVRLLRKHGVEVKVVLTRAARPLVGEESLRTVSCNPVFTDDAPPAYDMDHIRLSEWADSVLVCPATANTMAKMAHGIADNLLSTLLLAFEGPVMVAPAMNTNMWKNAATKANVATLVERGIRVLPVGSGSLACGTDGPGRMIEPDSVVEYVLGMSTPRCLQGKNVLIASGPTSEPIDPVRVLSNTSSGRMGAALTHAALTMGAQVTVVTGPAETPLPAEIDRVDVRTAAQMSEALSARFDDADLVIMVAAIADFRPKQTRSQKMKRTETKKRTIELVAGEDIAASLGSRKSNQFLVGFSLETGNDALDRAREKMLAKRCDMMVLNKADVALGTETSEVTLLDTFGNSTKIPRMDKRDVAREIMLKVSAQMGLLDA